MSGGQDREAAASAGPVGEHRDRTLGWVLAVALLVRLLVFPFAENKHADAPMRALLAEHRNQPGVSADPRTFFQFGPLPIEIMRPFVALGDVRVLSRVPSLLAGLLAFLPFFALARRLSGDRRVVVAAGLALAVSPLAVQLSTTAASESFYLLFWLACLERLHAGLTGRGRRDFVLAGLAASLAAVSRYDAWLAVPAAVVGAWVFGARDRRAAVDLLLFGLTAALLPAVYLTWLRASGADPWFFARTISGEHAAAGAFIAARWGGWGARAHQAAVWAVALVAVMTPVGLLGLWPAAWAWRRTSAASRAVLVAAVAPLALYVVKGMVRNDFAPLARFALVPAVVLLPVALGGLATRMRALGAAVAASGAAFAGLVSFAAFGGGSPIWGEAEALAPVTRLEPDAREVAEYLAGQRRPGESIFVDTFEFGDIMIAHAARVPLLLVASLAHTRELRDSLRDARRGTGADLFAAHDSSWGTHPLRDWPVGGTRIGPWRIARVH